MKTKRKRIQEELTSDERLVLNALQKNPKDDKTLIAKTCGFSKQKVKRILARLEADQIIWGYTAIIDEKPLGLLKYVLLMKRTMNKVDKATVEKIAFQVFEKEYEQQGITIESSCFMHGEYDWMIIFTSQNLRDAKKFSTMLVENYPDMIEKVNLMQILHSAKTHHILSPIPESLFEFL
jgi:DNA-binding Lrp family transcriptional regulator